MNDNENKFSYRYSAPTEEERREIENIRRRYGGATKEEDKLNRIRELDSKVKNPPLIAALAVGICGSLVFGLGMTMILEWDIVLWGIFVAVLGSCIMTSAYFIRKILTKRNKNKYGAEIVRLSDEILRGEQNNKSDDNN